MRILTVTTTFPRSRTDTIPRFVLDLSAQMAKRGHEVRVLTPHCPGAALLEVMDGVQVSRYRYLWPEASQTLSGEALHTSVGKSWLARLKVIPFVGMMLYGIQAEVLRFRPDLIHCHWLIPQGSLCAAIGKLNRIPVLVSMHGSDVFKYRTGLVDRLRRWTLKNVNVSVANSSAVCKRVESIYGDRPLAMQVPTIPMGVDTQFFHPSNETNQIRIQLGAEAGPLILAVGRLSPEKGLSYLLEAFPNILRRFPNATLAIAGYGPCEQSLKSQADSLNITKAVRWLGPLRREELAPLYASADVMVMPSIRIENGPEEALGLVLLEAMASGTVPVGSAIGGIPDIIRHGHNGMLAREKDSQDLAFQINTLLEDPGYRSQLAIAATETAEHFFSWNSVGSRYNSLYESICSSRAA